METGPPAVWLWNALAAKGLPILVLDARHAGAALKMRPDRTDRRDARGRAQIVRPGWDKEVRIESRGASVIRALLTARDAPVGIRVRLENAIRGLLRTFGVLFGRRVGGVMRRAEGIIAEELAIAPELGRSSTRRSRRGARSWSASGCSTPGCARSPARAASSACS